MSKPKKSPVPPTDFSGSVVREDTIEYGFIGTFQKLKYEYRPDITNRATLEANFREKFEALNRIHLTDSEFSRPCSFKTDDLVNCARLSAGEMELSLVS